MRDDELLLLQVLSDGSSSLLLLLPLLLLQRHQPIAPRFLEILLVPSLLLPLLQFALTVLIDPSEPMLLKPILLLLLLLVHLLSQCVAARC